MAQDFLGRILRDDLPNPADSPELFEGVLTRRVLAFVIDCIIMGAIIVALFIVGAIFGVLTLGLGWLALPLVIPASFVLYYGATLGSSARATIGMRMTDIVMTPTREIRLDGWLAFLHVVLFWISVSVLTPAILLVGLFTGRRELAHDVVAGVLMVRRSPMERRWRAYAAADPA